MKKKKIKRKDLKSGEVLCDYCTAKCCRYFALPIDKPKDIEDYQHLRWYMMHGRVSVFVEDDVWYLMVHADCKHIMPDNRCGAYQTRPTICRTYTTDNCEYEDDACYDQFFESPEQIWEYAQAVMPQPKKSKKRKKGKGVSLPVLA